LICALIVEVALAAVGYIAFRLMAVTQRQADANRSGIFVADDIFAIVNLRWGRLDVCGGASR
jgi:hypothetical protein